MKRDARNVSHAGADGVVGCAASAPVARAASDPPAERWQQLVALSLAELGALSLWFSASAVLPALTREWQLGDGGRAGLTLAVQLGFIAGTLVSAIGNLPDVWSSRRLMAASAVLGALANAAFALFANSVGPALVLRFVTGAAMAGAYPPAMKIIATWFRERRGLAIGVLIGALTVGSAAPHLIRGLMVARWRATLLVASALALLAAVIVLAVVREGPHRLPSPRFDPRMAIGVFRERPARLACFGYFGHMWELYAMWAWIGVFLSESFARRGATALNPAAATFAVIAAGALGCYAAGAGADRWGRTAVTIVAMAVSGTCAAVIGLTFGADPLLTLAVAVLWGITVVADSGQFSTAVTELSPPTYIGTALTTQTCVGFAITLVSIWLIPLAVRAVGWRWAFATLAVGPALGVIAMARLRGLPDARRMAGGRR